MIKEPVIEDGSTLPLVEAAAAIFELLDNASEKLCSATYIEIP